MACGLKAAYNYSDYRHFNSKAAGQDGSTHGHRLNGSVSVSKQFDLGNGFYLTPEVSVSAGREIIADYSASSPNGETSYVSGKLGGELAHQPTNGTPSMDHYLANILRQQRKTPQQAPRKTINPKIGR